MISVLNRKTSLNVNLFSVIKYIDKRGYFNQIWTSDELVKNGFREGFIQLNMAKSSFGVLRGMHRQNQTKMLHVLQGKIFDAVLNPETGEWDGWILEEGDSIIIPPNLAHGYLVLSESALVQYAVDKPYDPNSQEVFKWDKFNIIWPLAIRPILSNGDIEA